MPRANLVVFDPRCCVPRNSRMVEAGAQDELTATSGGVLFRSDHGSISGTLYLIISFPAPRPAIVRTESHSPHFPALRCPFPRLVSSQIHRLTALLAEQSGIGAKRPFARNPQTGR